MTARAELTGSINRKGDTGAVAIHMTLYASGQTVPFGAYPLMHRRVALLEEKTHMITAHNRCRLDTRVSAHSGITRVGAEVSPAKAAFANPVIININRIHRIWSSTRGAPLGFIHPYPYRYSHWDTHRRRYGNRYICCSRCRRNVRGFAVLLHPKNRILRTKDDAVVTFEAHATAHAAIRLRLRLFLAEAQNAFFE